MKLKRVAASIPGEFIPREFKIFPAERCVVRSSAERSSDSSAGRDPPKPAGGRGCRQRKLSQPAYEPVNGRLSPTLPEASNRVA